MRTLTLSKAWAGRPAGTVLRVLGPGDPPEYRPRNAVDSVRAAKLEAMGFVEKPKAASPAEEKNTAPAPSKPVAKGGR